MKKLQKNFGLVEYEVSINDLYEIIKDVYETSNLKDNGKFNFDDISLSLKRLEATQ